MRVTVVTLYDDAAVEHYVGVIEGQLSQEDRESIAARLSAEVYSGGEQEDDARYVYFRELETCKALEDLQELPNIDGLGA